MKFDLFGQNTSLLFKGQVVHKTKLGQVVSITIALVIILRLIFLIIQAAKRDDPQLMFQERFVKDPEKFYLTDESIQFAFGVMNSKGVYFHDPSLFTIQASEIKRVRYVDNLTNEKKVKRTNTTFEITTCTQKNFQQSKIQDYFASQEYNNKYCLKPNYNMTIEGDFNSEIFTSIYIHFKKCQGQGCKPIEEIDQILSDIMVDVAFSDVYVNPTDRQNPFVPFGRDAFWRASSSKSSSVQFNLRNNYVQSDDGWLLPSYETQLFPSYNFNSIDSSNIKTELFFEIIIRLEKSKENLYQRKYKGVLQLISEIGGFTNIFLAFGALICRKYAFQDFRHDLAGEIFEDDENRQENQIQQQLNQPIQNQVNLTFREQQIQNQQNQTNVTSNSPQIEALKSYPPLQGQKSVSYEKSQQISELEINSIFASKKNFCKNQVINNQSNKNNVDSIFDTSQQNQPTLQTSCLLLRKIQRNVQNTNNQQNSQINVANMQDLIDEKLKEMYPQIKPSKPKHKAIDYIFGALCPCRNKGRSNQSGQQQINNQINHLSHYIDIKYIIQKLMEIDKLKKILLTDDQIRILDLFPKPKCTQVQQNISEKQIEFDQLYNDKRKSIDKVKEGIESLFKTITKQNRNKIDKKLINLIDKKYISTFNIDQYLQVYPQSPQQDCLISEIQFDEQDQEVESKFNSPDQSYFGDKIQSHISSNIFKKMPNHQQVTLNTKKS